MTTIANFFKDKQGRVVIAQWPNTPLWLALGFKLISFIHLGPFQTIGAWGWIASLLYWSHLEIVSGVNPWRKLLGTVVAATQIVSLIKLLLL